MKERNGDGKPRERKWVWGRKRMMMCVREKKHIVDFKTFWLSVHQSIGVWVVFEIESKLKTLTGSYIQLTRQSLIKILSFFFFIFTLGYLALKLTYLNLCLYYKHIGISQRVILTTFTCRQVICSKISLYIPDVYLKLYSRSWIQCIPLLNLTTYTLRNEKWHLITTIPLAIVNRVQS